MHLPWVYTCSPSWTLLPPPSPYHPSGSSQCTSPNLPVFCIEPGLVISFLYDIIHVLMPFSQIIPPSLSHRVQKTVHTSVSLLLSRIQGGRFHLSKFHIYALVYCIGVFLSGLFYSAWRFLWESFIKKLNFFNRLEALRLHIYSWANFDSFSLWRIFPLYPSCQMNFFKVFNVIRSMDFKYLCNL